MRKLFIVCSIAKIKVYLIHLTLYGYLVHSPDGLFSLVLSETFTSTKLMIFALLRFLQWHLISFRKKKK